MVDGKYCPAELALVGEYHLLVDSDGVVFLRQGQTIHLRIEVFGLFPFSGFLSYNYHVAVAGLRRMGSAGEYLVQQGSRLIGLRPRSEPWTGGSHQGTSPARSW